MANHVDGLDLEAWGDVPPMKPRERTHYEGCWQAHLECAIAKINARGLTLATLCEEGQKVEAERDAAQARSGAKSIALEDLRAELERVKADRDEARAAMLDENRKYVEALAGARAVGEIVGCEITAT